MYIMGTLLRHGSPFQKTRYLPQIARGELRLQAFAVTEPDAGSDTTSIQTKATRRDDGYVIRGRKIFTSRVQETDLMLLLARTTPIDAVVRRSDGLSVFLLDLRDIDPRRFIVNPIKTMINTHISEVTFDDLIIPSESLIGEENRGFSYILDGMNAERILVAAQCVGDGHFFISRATDYASNRRVFGRYIGQNQGVQFPIARSYAKVEAADLMRWRAAELFDSFQPCAAEANLAKLLAADASWEAADVAMQTFGGFGFAVEYDIERKFRETRLYQTAPVSTNMILSYIAQHVLRLPRSY
jgi:acyl-CoA dehydrogenase